MALPKAMANEPEIDLDDVVVKWAARLDFEDRVDSALDKWRDLAKQYKKHPLKILDEIVVRKLSERKDKRHEDLEFVSGASKYILDSLRSAGAEEYVSLVVDNKTNAEIAQKKAAHPLATLLNDALKAPAVSSYPVYAPFPVGPYFNKHLEAYISLQSEKPR